MSLSMRRYEKEEKKKNLNQQTHFKGVKYSMVIFFAVQTAVCWGVNFFEFEKLKKKF